MSMPVQLSDLDLAVTADDADLALIRKSNTTDYKVTVEALRNINVAGLPSLPNPAQSTDPMIISQSSSNCQIPFGQVGFVQGTQMWFFSGSAPPYWTIIPNTGDRLLAVRGGSTYVTGGNAQGTWQQTDTTLTIDQIPAHTHDLNKTRDPTESLNNLGPQVGKRQPVPVPGNLATTESTGGGQGHNHGNTWRPLANVGLICQKAF